jgi:hypothetical protein
MDMYDPAETQAVMLYVRMVLGQMDQKEAFDKIRELGFKVGGGDGTGEIGELPDLSRYLPRIAESFGSYLRENLPLLGDHMHEERVETIASMVEDMIFEEGGPNMLGVLNLADEIDLAPETAEKFMGDIKYFMRSLIEEILRGLDMRPEDAENAIKSMSVAFESMSNEEYMIAMGHAFSGKGDMGAVEDFINTQFELPDMQGVSQNIYDQVTNFLFENLPGLKRFDEATAVEVQALDEEQIKTVVESVQNELRNDRGPDFYKLPYLFNEIGMDKEA